MSNKATICPLKAQKHQFGTVFALPLHQNEHLHHTNITFNNNIIHLNDP